MEYIGVFRSNSTANRLGSPRADWLSGLCYGFEMYLISADSLAISQAHFAVVSITLQLNCKPAVRVVLAGRGGC